MSALPEPVRILGYASPLSAHAGEPLAFHVGGETGGTYTATVHRLLGGGSDPRAPQLRSERVAELGTFPVLRQVTRMGSRAEASWPAPVELRDGTLVLSAQRRLVGGVQTLAMVRGAVPEHAFGVELSEQGVPRIVRGDEVVVTAEGPLPLARWTRIVVSWSASGFELSFHAGDGWRTAVAESATMPASAFELAALTLAASPVGDVLRDRRVFDRLVFDRHFTGRLERPVLLRGGHAPAVAAGIAGAPGDPLPADAVAGWEFSAAIGARSIPAVGTHPVDLAVHQAPAGAVRGSTWTSATDYRDAPSEFSALHFHEDDLEDAGWVSQTSWTVPSGARSGFYALHVVTDDGAVDWIPFFVRPEPGRPAADLLVVASSATYFAYANSRFWWEDPIQEIAQDRLVELGAQEQYLVTHPELGLSNYDRHLDGSPVVFSSRLRPNLFMRPGHSRAESYASDLYLIAWLERSGLAYDVVTDEDVHFDGADLLAPYRAIISGSHPEYLSIAMYDATKAWVEAGGRYFYLGGNGFTSCVTWRADAPWLMENRATGCMQNDDETTATETIHQLDGTIGREMGDSGRSPGSLWGVDSVTMGFDRSYPVLRSQTSYSPAFAWAFAGIAGRLFGGRSLSGGGVVGQEWDNARLVAGASAHHILASSIDHSLIPTVLGADAAHHGDVVAYFHGDGLVVSASSMAWVGALHIDDYDNDAERFVRNVVTRFLEPEAIAQPVPGPGGIA